jgi:hypothetical protein
MLEANTIELKGKRFMMLPIGYQKINGFMIQLHGRKDIKLDPKIFL